MGDQCVNKDKLNEHAVLITVFSLQLIVIYSSENHYDAWDLVLSSTVLWFIIENIRYSRIGSDRFSRLLNSILFGISSVTVFSALLGTTGIVLDMSELMNPEKTKISPLWIGTALVFCVVYFTPSNWWAILKKNKTEQ